MLRIHFEENGKMKIELSILTPKRKSVVSIFINIGKRKNVEKKNGAQNCAPFYVAYKLLIIFSCSL